MVGVHACCVCFSSYNTGNRRPWDLGCGHCVCEHCFYNTCSQLKTCPECRNPLLNPHPQFALLRILETRQQLASHPIEDACWPSPTPYKPTHSSSAEAAAEQVEELDAPSAPPAPPALPIQDGYLEYIYGNDRSSSGKAAGSSSCGGGCHLAAAQLDVRRMSDQLGGGDASPSSPTHFTTPKRGERGAVAGGEAGGGGVLPPHGPWLLAHATAPYDFLQDMLPARLVRSCASAGSRCSTALCSTASDLRDCLEQDCTSLVQQLCCLLDYVPFLSNLDEHTVRYWAASVMLGLAAYYWRLSTVLLTPLLLTLLVFLTAYTLPPRTAACRRGVSRSLLPLKAALYVLTAQALVSSLCLFESLRWLRLGGGGGLPLAAAGLPGGMSWLTVRLLPLLAVLQVVGGVWEGRVRSPADVQARLVLAKLLLGLCFAVLCCDGGSSGSSISASSWLPSWSRLFSWARRFGGPPPSPILLPPASSSPALCLTLALAWLQKLHLLHQAATAILGIRNVMRARCQRLPSPAAAPPRSPSCGGHPLGSGSGSSPTRPGSGSSLARRLSAAAGSPASPPTRLPPSGAPSPRSRARRLSPGAASADPGAPQYPLDPHCHHAVALVVLAAALFCAPGALLAPESPLPASLACLLASVFRVMACGCVVSLAWHAALQVRVARGACVCLCVCAVCASVR